MSNPYDTCSEAIAAKIRAEVAACHPDLEELERVDVVVWNEEDLLTLAAASTAKARGLAVIVSGLGGTNPDPAANTLQTGGRFSISVWRDVRIVGDLTAKELCWQCAKATHDMEVEPGPNHVARRLAFTEPCALRTVPNFIIWEALGNIKRLKSD
jgi:hypothetical protein